MSTFASRWELFVGVGIAGSLLGAAATYLFNEMSASRAARRQFAKQVSDEIAALARDYYWLLANYAGAVALALEQYVRGRNLILVEQEEAERRRERLERHAERIAADSVAYLVGVHALFKDFQFEQGNTYLLTDYWADRSVKQLYNRFGRAAESIAEKPPIAALSAEGDGAAGPRFVWRRLEQLEERGKLDAYRDAYAAWLLRGTSDVEEAAIALRTCSELLRVQLAMLYKDWFRRGLSRERFRREPADHPPTDADLPESLSAQARRAIQFATFESGFLRPAGVTMWTRLPTAPRPEREEAAAPPAPREEAQPVGESPQAPAPSLVAPRGEGR